MEEQLSVKMGTLKRCSEDLEAKLVGVHEEVNRAKIKVDFDSNISNE